MNTQNTSALITINVKRGHRLLPVPEGYYRSRLFIAPFTTNPIVTAAGPLLSFLERLNMSSSLPPIQQIRDNIAHELQAFHCQLATQKNSEEMIAFARYLISSTIDELIGKNYLRIYKEPAQFTAFTPPSEVQEGPEVYFFSLIHYLKEHPTQYLDLIELAYFCLLAGFEGINHQKADGRQTLDNLLEELFLLIQNHRVNKPYRLFNEQALIHTTKKGKNPLTYIGVCVISILSVTLFFTHAWVEKKSSQVMFGHHNFAKLD